MKSNKDNCRLRTHSKKNIMAEDENGNIVNVKYQQQGELYDTYHNMVIQYLLLSLIHTQ